MGANSSRAISALCTISLVLLCIGNYSNSLRNEFAFDDYLAIVNNADVLDRTGQVDIISQYTRLWYNDLWGKDLQALDSHRSYRPLLITLFKFIVQLFGLNASIFRIVSIFFHCTATLSIFIMTSVIFGNDYLAFGTSILFASHPVHVESVAAVVNMAEAASLTISIIAYLIYYHSSKCNMEEDDRPMARKKTNSKLPGIVKQMFRISLWFAMLTISVLFKETGIVLCGMVVASAGISLLCSLKKSYIAYVTQKKLQREQELQPQPQIQNNPNVKEQKSLLSILFMTVYKWIKGHALWVLSALSGVFWYSLFRVSLLSPSGSFFILVNTVKDIAYAVSNGTINEELQKNSTHIFHWMVSSFSGSRSSNSNPFSPTSSIGSLYPNLGYLIGLKNSVFKSYLGDSDLVRKAENPFAFLEGQEKLLSLMYLHFRYFYQLLWPSSLCAEYAFDCIPKVSSLSETRGILSVLFYASLLFSFSYCLFRVIVPTSNELINGNKSDDFNDNHNHNDDHNHDNNLINGGSNNNKYSVAWNIKADHYLFSFVWMIIPFIPASGVFLRLGTLLAERLLYTPSLGYCMLLSLSTYILAQFVCYVFFLLWNVYFINQNNGVNVQNIDRTERTEAISDSTDTVHNTTEINSRNNNLRLNKNKMDQINTDLNREQYLHGMECYVSKCLYWIIIIIIAALYTSKTISHNPNWYDDDAIHRHDVTVCPNSAKLQLQICKSFMNKGDYKTAKKHLERAKVIDPEFCDIGYQDAIIKIYLDNDVTGALEAAADNLSCMYTSTNSFDILNKVWENQLSQPGGIKDHNLLAEHARIAERGQLYPLAASKYQAACGLAFENKDYRKSLKYSMMAERLIPKMLYGNEEREKEEEKMKKRKKEENILKGKMNNIFGWFDLKRGSATGKQSSENNIVWSTRGRQNNTNSQTEVEVKVDVYVDAHTVVMSNVIKMLAQRNVSEETNIEKKVVISESRNEEGERGMEGKSNSKRDIEWVDDVGMVSIFSSDSLLAYDFIHSYQTNKFKMKQDNNSQDQKVKFNMYNTEKENESIFLGEKKVKIIDILKKYQMDVIDKEMKKSREFMGNKKIKGKKVKVSTANEKKRNGQQKQQKQQIQRDRQSQPHQSVVLMDQACMILSSAARIRSHLNNPILKFKPNKIEKLELLRQEELFLYSAGEYCVIVDPGSGVMIRNYAVDSLNSLSEIIGVRNEMLGVQEFLESRGSSYDGMNNIQSQQPLTITDNQKIDSLEKYAIFCESASEVFMKMALKNTEIDGLSFNTVNDLTHDMIKKLGMEEKGYLKQSDDMRASAVAVWLSVGIARTELGTEIETKIHNKILGEDLEIQNENEKENENENERKYENKYENKKKIENNRKDNKNIKNNNKKNETIRTIKNKDKYLTKTENEIENDNNAERADLAVQKINAFRQFEMAINSFQNALKYGIFVTHVIEDEEVLTLFTDDMRNSLLSTQIEAQTQTQTKLQIDSLRETQRSYLQIVKKLINPKETDLVSNTVYQNILLPPADGRSRPLSVPLGAPCRTLLWFSYALSATDNYFENEKALLASIFALKLSLKCSQLSFDDSIQMTENKTDNEIREDNEKEIEDVIQQELEQEQEQEQEQEKKTIKGKGKSKGKKIDKDIAQEIFEINKKISKEEDDIERVIKIEIKKTDALVRYKAATQLRILLFYLLKAAEINDE